jgi:hypothetical protein
LLIFDCQACADFLTFSSDSKAIATFSSDSKAIATLFLLFSSDSLLVAIALLSQPSTTKLCKVAIFVPSLPSITKLSATLGLRSKIATDPASLGRLAGEGCDAQRSSRPALLAGAGAGAGAGARAVHYYQKFLTMLTKHNEKTAKYFFLKTHL